MFKINFQIIDSPTLREWLGEPDFDPAYHLNGYIDINYRGMNFFSNYMKSPLNGRIPFESTQVEYLIFIIIGGLIYLLENPNDFSQYELGDHPQIFNFIVVNEDDDVKLFMHTYMEDEGTGIKEHWYDGLHITFQENRPDDSAFIIDKKEFLNGAFKSLEEFFKMVAEQYPDLNEHESMLFYKSKFQKIRKIYSDLA
jgi:hypothetical protein